MKLDPEVTRAELRSLEADILGGLGPIAPAGVLMRFMCEQFRLVVDLLEARGTDQFSAISNLLYGTAHDVFHAGGPNIAGLAAQMRHVLDGMAVQTSGAKDERVIPGSDAVGILQAQLDDSMGPGMIDVDRTTASQPTRRREVTTSS